MEQDGKTTAITAKKQSGKPFKKGDDPRRNLNGRPQGALSFKTKFYNVVDKLAKQNNISADEVEEQLMLVGYKKAKEGDYKFYQDLMDRVHGKPMQPTDMTSGGEKIQTNAIIFGKFKADETNS